jgi:hypothetical protein
MFMVFSSFDLIALLLLSVVFVGCNTRLGLLAIWVFYLLLGWWFQRWTVGESFSWFMNHLFDLGMYVLVYLAIGGAWSVFKWWLYVLKTASKLKEAIVRYNAIPDPKESWNNWSNGRFSSSAPSVRDNKSEIIDWIAFWWFSMIQTFLGDWMHQIFTAVYQMFYNMYDAIAKKIWGNIVIPK